MDAVDYDALVARLCASSAARRVGLLSQQASPTAELLRNRLGDRLACLFSPEHGWFGLAAAGEETHSTVHPFWQIPVHSLYGATRTPTPDMMRGLDRIVVDLQDIGVRCYTYLATLRNMLNAAAAAHVPVMVLDRPIPLGGVVDGPRLAPGGASFVAPIDVPLCHGMTPGECATYIVRTEHLDLDLDVVRLRGWSHAVRTPWMNFVPPSPAIRSWDCAALYPVTVFTEACPALDCDRYGSLAFRVLGAPWLDVAQVCDGLRDVLPSFGLGVRPIRYRPSGGPWEGQVLDGLLFSLEDPAAYRPVRAGVAVYSAVLKRHPEECARDARSDWFDKLMGTSVPRAALENDSVLDGLFASWDAEAAAFRAERVDLYAG